MQRHSMNKVKNGHRVKLTIRIIFKKKNRYDNIIKMIQIET